MNTLDKSSTKRVIRKMDGKTWLKYSISIWNDLRKSEEERMLEHPAVFPVSLVARLIDCYTIAMDDPIILDPFLGSGTTLLVAKKKGLRGVGFEVVKHFVDISYRRLSQRELFEDRFKVHLVSSDNFTAPIEFSYDRELFIVNDDARRILDYLNPESIHIVITSPPYWNIHNRRRSADGKKEKPYSGLYNDLGNLDNYTEFLAELKKIYASLYKVIIPSGYVVINVMDIRCGSTFIPYHCDTISICTSLGFKIEDIIIWDRRQDYNNLRPLGYPYKFIINKIHEYILIFRKERKEKA